MLALPIFPGRRQPSIVGRDELNYRVRNGNGWTLALISTNLCHPDLPENKLYYKLFRPSCQGFSLTLGVLSQYTEVRFWCTFTDSNRGPTD